MVMATLHLKWTLKKILLKNKNKETRPQLCNLHCEPFIIVELYKEDNINFMNETLSAPLTDCKSWQKDALDQYPLQTTDCKTTSTPNNIFYPIGVS